MHHRGTGVGFRGLGVRGSVYTSSADSPVPKGGARVPPSTGCGITWVAVQELSLNYQNVGVS